MFFGCWLPILRTGLDLDRQPDRGFILAASPAAWGQALDPTAPKTGRLCSSPVKLRVSIQIWWKDIGSSLFSGEWKCGECPHATGLNFNASAKASDGGTPSEDSRDGCSTGNKTAPKDLFLLGGFLRVGGRILFRG
jgi:hypothetical protein